MATKKEMKTIKPKIQVFETITSKNPIVNEIIAPRAMNDAKIARLNSNKRGKATGWLSDSKNK
jgi:hypothetical protein